MKVLFSLLFLAAFTAFSQDWSYDVYRMGTLYPGHIVKMDGEVVEGFVKAGTPTANQNKVIFYTDKKDKKSKVVYKAGDLKGYKVADKVYKSITYSGGISKKAYRYLLMTDEGPITMYKWYSTYSETTSAASGKTMNEPTVINGSKYDTKIIYQNGEGQPIEHGSLFLSWKKKAPALFEGHTDMISKIQNKEKGYGKLRVFELVKQYNEWKGNQ